MTVRVAILGAGIGAQHLGGYLALPGRFQVRAICDLDAARAQPLLAASGARHSDSIAAVLAAEDIDLVDICLPPHLHAEIAIAALRAGKQVICEKPLAASLAEADALIAVAQETGARVFPVFQYRYGRAIAEVAALRNAGLLGKAYAGTLETHWSRGADYYAVPWRGTWAGERGGAVLGHAIHIHDLLCLILGPIARVFAELATRVNDIETEDCAALSTRMQCGALVTSSITLGAAEDTSRLRLCFEGLTMESGRRPYAPAEDAWRYRARDADQAQIDRVLAGVAEPLPGFAGYLEAVADALDGRGGREVTLADGRRSLEFVTAVYASARSGMPVPLPLAEGHPFYRDWSDGGGGKIF